MAGGRDGRPLNSIHGTLSDLRRLAEIAEEHLAELTPGQTAEIREEFAPAAEYTLVLELRDDRFDPASADADLESAG